LEIILFLKCLRKTFGQFSKNYKTFYSKIVTKLFKIWVWDPGSGKKPIPDPGSRGQKAPYPGSRIRNTADNKLAEEKAADIMQAAGD
jgi:hypothetical protein